MENKEKIKFISQACRGISEDAKYAKSVKRIDDMLRTLNYKMEGSLHNDTRDEMAIRIAALQEKRAELLSRPNLVSVRESFEVGTATILYCVRAHLRGRVHIRHSESYGVARDATDLLDIQAKLIENYLKVELAREKSTSKHAFWLPRLSSELRQMIRELLDSPRPAREIAA